MMVDPHNLGLPCLCLLWKAAPNILLSLGGSAQSQFLQLRTDNPALMAARISLMSLLADYTGKPRTSKQADRKRAHRNWADRKQPDCPARLDYPKP
jgi:hypothetical protein